MDSVYSENTMKDYGINMKAKVIEEDGEYILLLPDEICEQLDLSVGDTMTCWTDSDGNICLRKVDKRDWRYFSQ